jgi:hypothetical protein
MIRIRCYHVLTRILGTLLFAVGIVACSETTESKLVGTWEWKGCDDAGEITYRKDHTFISREWALGHTQQPPVIFDSGDWHVRNGQLFLNFKGESRPPDARHLVTKIVLCMEDVLVLRNTNGLIRTFQHAQMQTH